MHYLNESHIYLFLLQVFILLVSAKVLGGLCQRYGFPALTGGIIAGILLGPTVLGRLLPHLHSAIFPMEIIQATMLETVSWFGVLFLLLTTGFDVSISTVWKQGKVSSTIGFIGVLFPFLVGCVIFWWFPEKYWGENANHLVFMLFLATAAAITDIPVTAKILHDMDILKSDFGLITLTALFVNDLMGWVTFALILGLVTSGVGDSHNIVQVFLGIILFTVFCLTIGTKIVGAIALKLRQSKLPQPGTTLTFICCLGLICGAITQRIGIHAIIGFFLAGIMAGNTSEIQENTRQTISQVIHAIFVPIFFTSIGLQIDFLNNFDIPIVAVVTMVAIGGKFVGAWLGGRMAGLSKPDSLSIGIVHIPGGAMAIILGLLAMELKLINESVFVAIVFAALSSSIAVGPLLSWSLRRREQIDVSSVLLHGAVDLNLKGATRWEVIPALCNRIAGTTHELNAESLTQAVLDREKIMGTGLDGGVAVPHARLKGITKAMVAFGLSREGVNWNAPDGQDTRFVFLIITPDNKDLMQIQILATIARAMSEEGLPEKLMKLKSEEEAFKLLSHTLAVERIFGAVQPA